MNNLDFQFRPSITTYDMFNSEKLPYSAEVYGRDLRQGDYRTDSRNLFESNTDFQVRYHKNEIAGFLDLSAVGGANARNLNFNSSFESTNYLNTPGTYSFSNSQGTLTGNSFNSSMLVLSAYYSVDLGYKSYITANITGRVDKSSSLPSNAGSYFYPSYNLATVVSDYVNLPKVISFLKLRAPMLKAKVVVQVRTFSANVSSTPAVRIWILLGFTLWWANSSLLSIFTTIYIGTYLFQSEQCNHLPIRQLIQTSSQKADRQLSLEAIFAFSITGWNRRNALSL